MHVGVLKRSWSTKAPLTVEGVGEDAQGGFVALAEVTAGVEGRAAEAFESAEEGFDVPAPSVAVGFERPPGHLRTVTAAQGAVSAMHHRFDHAAHAPDFAADPMN